MDRDYDKEKIIDKMRELRDKRDLEISKIRDDIDLSKNMVKDVKYMGKIELDGEKDVFLIIEQREVKDGELIEIEKICDEEGNVIAGNNKADSYNFISLSEKYLDREDSSNVLKQLSELDKEGELDLNQIEQERIDEIAKELGIDPDEIERLAEIEADKEIEIEKDEEDKEDKEEEKEEIEDGEKKEFSEKEIEKVTTKTEVKTNQKVTDNQTMASLLKVQDKGYKKIAIVDSSKLKGNDNTTRFTVVGIKEDGGAEKIDTLEQRYGNEPTKNVNRMNNDGTEIQEQKENSIFQVKGRDEDQVGVRIGTHGTLEVDYIRTPRQDNEEAISIPIETHSIRPTTREVRELMNSQKNRDVNEKTKKTEEHMQEGDPENGQDITLNDINEKVIDDTHVHLDNEENLEELADEVLKYDVINSTYNREDVKAKIEEIGSRSENEGISAEKLVEVVEEEMEEQADKEHELPGQNRNPY